MLISPNSISTLTQRRRPSILAQAYILVWGLGMLYYVISMFYANLFENTIITKTQAIVNKAQEVKQALVVNEESKYRPFAIDVQMGRSKVAYLFNNDGRDLQYYNMMFKKNDYAVEEEKSTNRISASKDGWKYVIQRYNEQNGWRYIAETKGMQSSFLLIIEKDNLFNNIFPFISLQMTNRKIWLAYTIIFLLSDTTAGLYFTYCYIKWRRGIT